MQVGFFFVGFFDFLTVFDFFCMELPDFLLIVMVFVLLNVDFAFSFGIDGTCGGCGRLLWDGGCIWEFFDFSTFFVFFGINFPFRLLIILVFGLSNVDFAFLESFLIYLPDFLWILMTFLNFGWFAVADFIFGAFPFTKSADLICFWGFLTNFTACCFSGASAIFGCRPRLTRFTISILTSFHCCCLCILHLHVFKSKRNPSLHFWFFLHALTMTLFAFFELTAAFLSFWDGKIREIEIVSDDTRGICWQLHVNLLKKNPLWHFRWILHGLSISIRSSSIATQTLRRPRQCETAVNIKKTRGSASVRLDMKFNYMKKKWIRKIIQFSSPVNKTTRSNKSLISLEWLKRNWELGEKF